MQRCRQDGQNQSASAAIEQQLTAEMLFGFVEKILVYNAERTDGRRVQRIKTVWNCIGKFTPPISTSATEQ